MKFEASDKTASFSKKPHIKKGYYPAKLLSVEKFLDKEGNEKEGKYGKQVIFEFAVYKADPESGAPVEPMKYKPFEDSKELEPVIIPKFVYHEYKDRKNPGKFMTAVTLNSKITKILKALGWEFDPQGGDFSKFIGNWAELNIDDYDTKQGDETYPASTVRDVNPYKGPKPGKVEEVKPREFKDIKKQVKHADAVNEEIVSNNPKITDLQFKIKELKKLHSDGYLTKEGLDQATEQIESKIGKLRKE